MQPTGKLVQTVPRLLYVEPISACNLACRMCYAGVINGHGCQTIPSGVLLDFLGRFLSDSPEPADVYWCGTGEVFLYPQFPRIVNHLTAAWPQETLNLTVQTNGTVLRLEELERIERIDFRVSVDGSRRFHDWNRGAGNYDRTMRFCREAKERGCRSLTIRMLLTRENIARLDEFQQELSERVGPDVSIWLNIAYTNYDLAGVRLLTSCVTHRPFEDEKAISRSEALSVLNEEYQNRYELDESPGFVKNYLSLTVEGVFGCCHRITRLGDADTDIRILQEALVRATEPCRRCPLFPCE